LLHFFKREATGVVSKVKRQTCRQASLTSHKETRKIIVDMALEGFPGF